MKLKRIVGRERSGKATIEFTMLQVEGLQDMEAGSLVVKRKESAKHPGRCTFQSSINVRRGLWSGNGPLAKLVLS